MAGHLAITGARAEKSESNLGIFKLSNGMEQKFCPLRPCGGAGGNKRILANCGPRELEVTANTKGAISGSKESVWQMQRQSSKVNLPNTDDLTLAKIEV